MKRLATYVGVAILALTLGIAISVYQERGSTEGVPVVSTSDIPVTEHPLTDLIDGTTRKLKDWQGQYLLVNFWATWCGPCREEIPLLQQARNEYRDRNLEVVGIAFDEAVPVMAFRNEYAIEYPLVLALDDPFTLLANSGNHVGGLPHSVLLDQAGNILASHTGAISRDQLQDLLDRHIAPR